MRSFERTLRAARSGADWAWREIHAQLSPAVLAYLRAQRALDPEDLASEVFVHVVRDIDSFDGEEAELRAWALAIARNRLLDDLRRRSRRPRTVGDETLVMSRPAGDVESEALENLSEAEVRALMDGLSEEQREVLVLRIIGDLTVAQVAKILGKRQGAVKALQRRGLAEIRHRLASLDPSGASVER